MNKSSKYLYRILPEHNLIIDVLIGDISFFDIINNKMNQMTDKNWQANYNILCDVRLANIIFREEEIINFNNANSKKSQWNIDRKSASLTRSPNQVVFETMLDLYKDKENKIQLGTFSTVDAALDWLNVDSKYVSKVEDIIAEMKRE